MKQQQNAFPSSQTALASILDLGRRGSSSFGAIAFSLMLLAAGFATWAHLESAELVASPAMARPSLAEADGRAELPRLVLIRDQIGLPQGTPRPFVEASFVTGSGQDTRRGFVPRRDRSGAGQVVLSSVLPGDVIELHTFDHIRVYEVVSIRLADRPDPPSRGGRLGLQLVGNSPTATSAGAEWLVVEAALLGEEWPVAKATGSL